MEAYTDDPVTLRVSQPADRANGIGDYVSQERKTNYYLEGGLWGIMRVRDALEGFDGRVRPLPDRRDEDEFEGERDETAKNDGRNERFDRLESLER
ncbi:hypothetical protein C497_12157 [Halalkalicoccus jeotgali B3]|uniref:Uncharacterized protein n=1 Tax=Halalkalicoccus jeotgali (strain DSM 18796 / CECT 7217 / JCM 14584 / KCTC 4019 / B3) TaxID=795797 RepID=D8J493_HALJB|nr:hypothetical protein HacjB3_10510 [Halalkalicoccus jeotgali B3]ELY36106.1 hypothetical protein C497_12157 [Halalkalicoccus jeotgali B3]